MKGWEKGNSQAESSYNMPNLADFPSLLLLLHPPWLTPPHPHRQNTLEDIFNACEYRVYLTDGFISVPLNESTADEVYILPPSSWVQNSAQKLPVDLLLHLCCGLLSLLRLLTLTAGLKTASQRMHPAGALQPLSRNRKYFGGLMVPVFSVAKRIMLCATGSLASPCSWWGTRSSSVRTAQHHNQMGSLWLTALHLNNLTGARLLTGIDILLWTLLPSLLALHFVLCSIATS